MTLVPLLLAALGADPATPETPPAPAPAASQPAPSPAATAKPDVPAKRPSRRPGAPRASLPTVEGELIQVDHRAHRITLRTASGDLVLAFDRNTLVLAPMGATTPLQLAPGDRIRAGREGDARAAWIELGTLPSTPAAGP